MNGVGGGTFRKGSNSKMGNDKKQLQFRRFERKVKQIEEKPNKNIKEINQKSVGGTDCRQESLVQT